MSNLPAPQPAEVTRVVCASVSRVTGSVMEQLFDIRNRACGPEPVPGVRGALLYTSGWFVLWLEGTQAAVEIALARAANDSRNHHQKIVHRSVGAPTLVEPLNVTSTQAASSPADMARRIYRMHEEFNAGKLREPAAIWQELSAPCMLGPRHAPCTAPHQHMALVSADDHGPVDLLRKLGDRFGSKLVYQRFSGSRRHSNDVGAAYVDIPVASQVRRIHLISRRALSHAVVRQSLACLDTLLLFLGSRPASAIELASTVAPLVGDLPRKPSVCLLNAREEISEVVGALLRRGPARIPNSVVTLDESRLSEFLVGSAAA